MKYIFIALLFFTTLSSAQSVKNISFDFNQIDCQTDPKELIGQQIYFFKPNQMFMGKQPETDTLYQGLISETPTPLNSLIPDGYVKTLQEGDWHVFDANAGKSISFDYNKNMTTNVYKPVMAVSNMHQLLLFTPYVALSNRLFTIVDCSDSLIVRGQHCLLKFVIKDDKGEIIHWLVNPYIISRYPVCFKSFIDYLKQNYAGKKLYIKKDSWVPAVYYNPLDKMTYMTQPGQEWTCSDMTLLNDPIRLFPNITLLLSGNGKTLAIDPGKNMIPDYPLPLSAFWTEPEYTSYMEQETKRHDSLATARKEQETRLRKTQPEYVQKVIKKYGKEIGDYLIKDEVAVGMTKAICKDAWGEPETKKQYIYKQDTIEVWSYAQYRWLRFKGNKLDMINE